MKTTNSLLCILLFVAIAVKAQNRQIAFSDINTAATAKQGDAVNQSDYKGTTGKDLIIEITGVNIEADIDPFKFYAGPDEMDKVKVLSKVYDASNKTYKVNFGAVIRGFKSSSTIEIKKNDKTVYSFDVKVGNSETGSRSQCEQGSFQQDAQVEFDNRILNRYKDNVEILLKDKNNLYIDKNNTVHIFVDHYGKYYGYAPPTTATEKYTYQVHLITSDCLAKENLYFFDYTGNYNPTFNIDKNASAQSAGPVKITVIDFARIGPFTEKFNFSIKRAPIANTNQLTEIVKADVSVPKLYHVSITTGLIATTLRNPQNIEQAPLNTTQNTLIADDPNIRGLITVMAIFYPQGRSFLYPPHGQIFDPSRFGVVVGTQFGKDANENFLGGLSFDFARGGAVILGAHFGRRNVIPGHRNFDFGEDVFTESALNIKKEWNVGAFFGVSIDMRVAAELLKTLFTAP